MNSAVLHSLPTKCLAALVHMSLSGVLVLIAWALTYYLWYPSIHYDIDGGSQGIKILMWVEVALGPSLTAVVFSESKPKNKLRLDITLIAIAQLVFYFYGLYTIYKERPIAVALVGDTFYTASQVSYDFYGVNTEYLQDIKGKTPKMLFITPSPFNPDDPLAKVKRIPDRMNQAVTSPIGIHKDDILKNGILPKKTADTQPEQNEAEMKAWKLHSKSHPNARFLKIIGKYESGLCLFDTDSEVFLSFLKQTSTN